MISEFLHRVSRILAGGGASDQLHALLIQTSQEAVALPPGAAERRRFADLVRLAEDALIGWAEDEAILLAVDNGLAGRDVEELTDRSGATVGPVIQGLHREVRRWSRGAPVKVLLEREEGEVETGQVGSDGICHFSLRTPGRYRLLTDTGLLLWEGSIDGTDIFIVPPCADRPLRAAASSEGLGFAETMDQPTLQGDMTVTVCAGDDQGHLTLRPREGGAS